jgi:hypothetical protein
MRTFLAGATGVIGIRLLPLLVGAGHTVFGMTRSPEEVDRIRALGGEPVVCDVYDVPRLVEVVTASRPDAVIHQLTDLPDRLDGLQAFSARNDRMRSEGTRNLLAAATAAGARQFLAQSIAWRPPGRGDVVDDHERQVLDAHGVVIRYGRLYGPGTFYQDCLPPPPRIQVDAAARDTVSLLEADTGIVVLVEDAAGA